MQTVAEQNDMVRGKIMTIICIALLIFGLIFLCIGIGIGKSQSNKITQCTEKVSAVVIENQRVSSHSAGSRRSTSYSPVFRYNMNGREYTVVSGFSQSPPAFAVGEETELFVDPKDPNNFYAPKMKTAKIISVIFSIVGGVIIGVAVILFALSYKLGG